MAIDLPPQHEEENENLASHELKIWTVVVPIAIAFPVLVAIVIFIYRRYRKHKAAKQRDIAFETRQRGWDVNRQEVGLEPPSGIFHSAVFQHGTEERSRSTPTIQLSRTAHKDSSSALRGDVADKDKDLEAGAGHWARPHSLDIQRATSPRQLA